MSPNKGEPPLSTDMKHQHWSHDVIRTITDDNDNIQRPCVRLIFEQHNIPTTNISSNKQSPYIYKDECGFALNDNDVFCKTFYIPKKKFRTDMYLMTLTFRNNNTIILIYHYQHHTSVLTTKYLPTHQTLLPR